jgi:3-mercaptopyruvate sulfurtransferase SseA
MVGMRASVVYFVARHLGYDARLYDGSIVDWTQRKLPAVTGRQ